MYWPDLSANADLSTDDQGQPPIKQGLTVTRSLLEGVADTYAN